MATLLARKFVTHFDKSFDAKDPRQQSRVISFLLLDDFLGSIGKGLWGLGKATIGRMIPGGEAIMDKIYETVPFRKMFSNITGGAVSEVDPDDMH